MPENNDKVLPKDTNSDHSMPGRLEESSSEYYDIENVKPKPKNKAVLVIAVSFVIVFTGFFSYYFMNQSEIDSQIIQNTINLDPEERLVIQYNVGEYGSEHEHAAIVVFVEGEQINFGMQQFQISSKYIHFENHNPYMIHKHATGVPLEMLFASINMKVTQDCMELGFGNLVNNKTNQFCADQDQSLVVYVNGAIYHSDISQYVLKHNDRIMISFGNGESVSKNLAYLESLSIADIPKKIPQYSGNEISI